MKLLLTLLVLLPSVAFCKFLKHDPVNFTGGEYRYCSAEMALDEDDTKSEYALRNIRCVVGDEVWTVLTLTWVNKADVVKP